MPVWSGSHEEMGRRWGGEREGEERGLALRGATGLTLSKDGSGKAASRLNILRALSDSAFGKDRECLIGTFKSHIRSLFDFAAPIIYPNYSQTSLNRLQHIQNRALRLALGCYATASVGHLHAEACVLPVEAHLKLISAQFLQARHPSHPHVILDRGNRNIVNKYKYII